MTKLGKFAAACAAVLCAFGAAADTPNLIVNGSFEEGKLSGNGNSWQQNCPDANNYATGWTGKYGLSNKNNTWCNKTLPDGNRIMFLQMSSVATNMVSSPAHGLYRLSFSHAQRSGYAGVSKHLTIISLDGEEIMRVTADSQDWSVKSCEFEMGAGEHVLVFKGVSAGTDQTGLFDKMSIVFVKGLADCLTIDGSPELIGEVSPAYGYTNGVAVGASFTCSAPAAWTNADETVVETCIGYKVYTNDIVYVEGSSNSFAYVHPHYEKGAMLVWLWKKYRRVTVAVAGGEDAPTVLYLSEGDPIAAPKVDGKTFAYWSGDIVDLSVFNATVKQTGDVNRALVANYVDEEPEIVENTYTGAKDGKWNVDGNWSLKHIPTAYETAVVPTGKGTVVIEDSAVCAKLVINNDAKVQLNGTANTPDGQPRLDVRGDVVIAANGLQLGNGTSSIYQPLLNVGGDLMVSNHNRTASLYVYAGDPWNGKTANEIKAGYWGSPCPREAEYRRGGAWVNVRGKLFLGGKNTSNTSYIYPYSNAKTGMSPVFRVGSLEIGAKGYVDGYQTGWISANGYHGKGTPQADGGGASYGGRGGSTSSTDPSKAGATYGWAYAPYWPGSAGGRGGTDGGHGGGLFRLHATGEVSVAGTIRMLGRDWWSNTTRAGGSGGGIWITCATFTPAATAKLSAVGGAQSIENAAAGGGGRICVAAGCTSEADIQSFITTGACDGFVATDFAKSEWPKLADASGGKNTYSASVYPGTKPWLDGQPGTAFFLQNTRGKASLTVTAEPLRIGTADPTMVTHVVDEGNQVCTMSEIAYLDGTSNLTRMHCAGAVWTNAVTSGSATTTTVTVPAKGDTVLVWLFGDKEHWLDVSSGGYGSVSMAAEWVDDASEVTLTATPEAGCTFVRWVGDVAAADRNRATITFTMDAPKRLVAVFDKPSAESRAFTFDGTGDWFDPAAWDGTAIPTTNDTVTVTGNATLSLAAQVDIGNLVVSAGTLGFNQTTDCDMKLAVAGNLTVENGAVVSLGKLDRVSRADIAVGGDLTLNGTGKIEIFAGEGATEGVPDWRAFKAGGSSIDIGGDLVMNGTSSVVPHCAKKSGLGVVFNVGGDVTIASGAQIVAGKKTGTQGQDLYEAYGWYAPYGYGYTVSAGGSHGGSGGFAAASKCYGFAHAPYYPGGAGSISSTQGHGGGSVRLAVKGDVELDGKIIVTGGQHNGSGNQTGAGGSVWITCDEFKPGDAARIMADGARATQHSAVGGGGGGRIAIMSGSPTEEQIDALYETGTCEYLLVIAEDMNDGTVSPYPVLANVKGGVCNDQAANLTHNAHGKPGTAVLLKNAYGQAVVTVDGNVPTTETKPAYGTQSVDVGEFTFTAPEAIFTADGLSRYLCEGYEWEDADGNTGSGDTTEFTLDVKCDVAIRWKWSTIQHKLRLLSGGKGAIAWDGREWYTAGEPVTLVATPSAGFAFDQWAGEFDYADGANRADTLTVTMSEPREIFVLFTGGDARTVTWTGAKGDANWFDPENWDADAIPNAGDTVVVTGGCFQVRYPCDIRLASFAVSGSAAGFVGCKTNVNTLYSAPYTTAMRPLDRRNYTFVTTGDFSLGGKAKVYFGGNDQTNRMDVTVGGDMTLEGNASGDRSRLQIYAGYVEEWTNLDNYIVGGGSLTVGGAFRMNGYVDYTPVANRRSGSVVPLRADTAYIGTNACINVRCRGFGKSYRNPGSGWQITRYGFATSGNSSEAYGGTYGGQGGYNATASFGYEWAPFYPGSTGGNPSAYTGDIFSGGGAVRIHARKITLDGTINANAHGEYRVGGGSGGGVWLTCRKFFLGAKGKITAKHDDGSSYGGTGGGGGGRIAIATKISDRQIETLYRTGSLRDAQVTALKDMSEWDGHFDVSAGTGPSDGKNGTAGTAIFMVAPPSGFMLIVR